MIPIEYRPRTTWTGPMTEYRRASTFKVNIERTFHDLDYELDRLDAARVVMELALRSFDVRVDGRLKANAYPSDPGVALSFDCVHGPLRYQTDVFDTWHDNLRAIALGLEALRAVDRYGISGTGQQYQGWNEIGSGAIVADAPMDRGHATELLTVMSGIAATTIYAAVEKGDTRTIRQAYRLAAKLHHPDTGGDAGKFRRLAQAYRVLGGTDA